MTRRRFQLLFLTGSVLGLAAVVWVWTATPLWQVAARYWGLANYGEIRSVAFELPRDRWLNFDIAATPDEIKVMSNALLPATEHQARVLAFGETEPIYAYSVAYRVVATDGSVLVDGVHHHRTVVLLARDARTGQLRSTNWLEDAATVAAATQPLRFSFGQGERELRLQLRLHDTAPQVSGVLVRAYTHDLIEEENLGKRWLRLSQDQQEGLAQSTLYPADLLSTQEKLNLIRNRWRPHGADGIAGEDFRQVNLFSRRGIDEDYVPDPIAPAGLVVNRGRPGMFPIPPDAGDLELQVAAFGEYGAVIHADRRERPIRLTWFGPGPGQTEEFVLDGPGMPLVWRGRLEPGRLQVESQDGVVVRLFGVTGEERVELTPEPVYLRSYAIAPGRALVHEVEHIDGHATPLRVDLRVVARDPALLSAAVRVRYSLLDDDAVVVETGELQTLSEISRYDRPADDVSSGWVTEPSRNYFQLAENVSRIRLEADETVFASIYTRPPDVAYRINPSRDYVPWASLDERLPRWFLAEPRGRRGRDEPAQSVLLHVQDRPPRLDPMIGQGVFDWKWIRPVGVWRGREILAPVVEGQPLREESRGARYRPLQPGVEQRLEFAAETGVARVQPRLIYTRSSGAPQNVRIELDGEVVIEERLLGRHGEMRLPTVDAGRHSLLIRSSADTRWLVNYAGGEAPDAFLQRTAQQLQAGRTLKLRYQKQTAETEVLTARVFAPQGNAAHIEVRVKGMPRLLNTSMQDWTASQREFLVPAAADVEARALLQKGEVIERVRDQRLFIVLGSNLPPGEYPIEVTLTEGEDIYAQFYRLLPGRRQQREVYRYDTEQPL